ncbi:hypothetical protein GCM10029976_056330 [Kribbella albertanoniae]|uniref:Uncharacterized protein n=1 Tax=Kribbella albertanoniae TaxID=1266829 RepID=A0A4R4PS75_9ACTN|nr:hypothetical protein [Kribbella albertanoniae]TDC25003.1 hypothetical protein E1261_25075 [Kribbella albertanoniae]
MKVTTYRELMAEQARAAVRVSGAHHSSWNGKVGATDPNEKIRGSVGWDHTINYSDELVTVPLKDMFENSRVYNQDPATLRSYREAVKTVHHENTHALAAEGTEHVDGQAAYQNSAERALEEGITEVHSYDNLNEYIDELGLEEIAPGIKSAEAQPSYDHYTPAARRFTEGIGRNAGVEPSEVVRRLAVVNPAEKFRTAAEVLYENSDLPGKIPEQEREAAIGRIEAAMKPSFSDLENLKTEPDKEKMRRQSAIAGARGAQAGVDEVKALSREWSQPAPETRVERGVATEQDRSNGQAPQESAPQQTADGAQPQELPPDLAAAVHASRSGSEPLSSASRLSEDQMGSRRSGTDSSPERSPEIQR